MPINQPDAAPAPPVQGLRWPGHGDEPSRAGQSLPADYLDVSGGGWRPAQDLMDLCADRRIPDPSESALEVVGWTTEKEGPAAVYQLLLATAITVLERNGAGPESRRGAEAVAHLHGAGLQGVLFLKGAADRPNEARPFA